jgi:pyruvate dehydrogenase E2 component (dihydrolipoamide acetyltransferase)
MEEATILVWLKAPGEKVTRGEPLVEIETDKATMVYEAEADGVLGEILVAEGETATLGAPLAELLAEGGAPPPTPTGPASSGRIRATPVARRIAADRGVALGELIGSGPGGRIVRDDVLAAAGQRSSKQRDDTEAAARGGPAAEPRATANDSGDELVQLTSTQRTIARRMAASRSEVPDFTLTAEIDMTAAIDLRRKLLEAWPQARLSVNDLIVRAVALALRSHPRLNASWAGDHIVRHARVNVGVAVATEDALLVPVLADADRKSPLELGAEARRLSERARLRELTREEMSGATFTVSNLGMLGVTVFDAVIDAPQVAILAVGAIRRRPDFGTGDVVVAREVMNVSLSCDHRAVNGADGARFLVALAENLENPIRLTMPLFEGGEEGGTR